MAIQKLPIHEVLSIAENIPVFDVRSPSEYKHAHIPNAISLPIFDDEQRAKIGTTYKQKSVQDAVKIGLNYFGADFNKHIEIVEQHAAINNNKKIIVHCWRGGMRSSAMAWLLDFYGFEVILVDGGYKSYRNYVLNAFALPFNFNVLGGNTGSAKTETLAELKKIGEAVIDLEALASHKGSAFGGLGMKDQPSQEQFENDLQLELSKYYAINTENIFTQEKIIWVENESQRIGSVNIPKLLFELLLNSKLYILNIPFEERLNFIVEHYGCFSIDLLIDSVNRIQRKLGGLEAQNTISYLSELNIKNAFELLLIYYDRGYKKASARSPRIGIEIDAENIDFVKNAELLMEKEYKHGRV